ncbi:MAG TPA: hypothetical protein VJQ59_09140 [Candidatus Sulfotelmatobacter sp.]|nr:hypothetical protein [Candidatus Sulfotelmatobacter sp.]
MLLLRPVRTLGFSRLLGCVALLVFPFVVVPVQTNHAGSAPSTLDQDQIRALMREAAEHDLENEKRQRDYTYIEREEQHKLDSKGDTKSVESKTHEIMVLYEEPVERLIAKDDKPLSAKDAAKEDERLQKIIDKRKNESEGDRKKRLEKEEKERDEGRQFIREVNEAYNFKQIAVQNIDGRDAWVIDAEPRKGYEPHLKEARVLPKFRFRVWIDQADKEWVKLSADCIDTVSFGWFLARIHKGSHIDLEQTRINDEVWLLKHIAVRLDARVALLANVNVSEEIAYRDYRKFRTDTRIVPAGEVH